MIKFECPECKTERLIGPDGWKPVFVSDIVISATCPNCAKLTYGPLTEEMVAEALRTAGEQGRWQDGASYHPAQARFVLRLLGEWDQNGDDIFYGKDAFRTRDWLLELAKKS